MDALEKQQNEMRLLRAREVAEVLQVSRSLAYRLIQMGSIPSVRVNHSVRVRYCDLQTFIQKNWTGWMGDPMVDPLIR